MTPARRVTFDDLARTPGDALDVALGAALIARDAYDTLDVYALLARFDELAAPLVGAGLESLPAREQAERVATHVFQHLGFRGNVGDYYDPRNSLLPDVLERKTGIPISLSLVYCEVAKRAGLSAARVSQIQTEIEKSRTSKPLSNLIETDKIKPEHRTAIHGPDHPEPGKPPSDF